MDESGYAPPLLLMAAGLLLIRVGALLARVDDNLADLGSSDD